VFLLQLIPNWLDSHTNYTGANGNRHGAFSKHLLPNLNQWNSFAGTVKISCIARQFKDCLVFRFADGRSVLAFVCDSLQSSL
jgi:hypothetical protein